MIEREEGRRERKKGSPIAGARLPAAARPRRTFAATREIEKRLRQRLLRCSFHRLVEKEGELFVPLSVLPETLIAPALTRALKKPPLNSRVLTTIEGAPHIQKDLVARIITDLPPSRIKDLRAREFQIGTNELLVALPVVTSPHFRPWLHAIDEETSYMSGAQPFYVPLSSLSDLLFIMEINERPQGPVLYVKNQFFISLDTMINTLPFDARELKVNKEELSQFVGSENCYTKRGNLFVSAAATMTMIQELKEFAAKMPLAGFSQSLWSVAEHLALDTGAMISALNKAGKALGIFSDYMPGSLINQWKHHFLCTRALPRHYSTPDTWIPISYRFPVQFFRNWVQEFKGPSGVQPMLHPKAFEQLGKMGFMALR